MELSYPVWCLGRASLSVGGQEQLNMDIRHKIIIYIKINDITAYNRGTIPKGDLPREGLPALVK